MTPVPAFQIILALNILLEAVCLYRIWPIRAGYPHLAAFFFAKVVRTSLFFAFPAYPLLGWIWLATEVLIEIFEVLVCLEAYRSLFSNYPGKTTKSFAGSLMRESVVTAAMPCLAALFIYKVTFSISWQWPLIHSMFLIRQLVCSTGAVFLLWTWFQMSFVGGYIKKNVRRNWFVLAGYFAVNAIGFGSINTRWLGTTPSNGFMIIGEFIAFTAWTRMSRQDEWVPTYTEEQRVAARAALPEARRREQELHAALAGSVGKVFNSLLGKDGG